MPDNWYIEPRKNEEVKWKKRIKNLMDSGLTQIT